MSNLLVTTQCPKQDLPQRSPSMKAILFDRLNVQFSDIK